MGIEPIQSPRQGNMRTTVVGSQLRHDRRWTVPLSFCGQAERASPVGKATMIRPETKFPCPRPRPEKVQTFAPVGFPWNEDNRIACDARRRAQKAFGRNNRSRVLPSSAWNRAESHTRRLRAWNCVRETAKELSARLYRQCNNATEVDTVLCDWLKHEIGLYR
jgi:hypothetical protein